MSCPFNRFSHVMMIHLFVHQLAAVICYHKDRHHKTDSTVLLLVVLLVLLSDHVLLKNSHCVYFDELLSSVKTISLTLET